MRSKSPVLMIGLDAAEFGLAKTLCAEGKLPTLASLLQQGTSGALETEAASFAGGVWPSFFTSKKVPWHGIYHNKLWRQANMRCETPDAAWLSEEPFWQDLDRQGYRVAILDVPMTVTPPRLAHGIQIAGWGTHDLIAEGCWPGSLWQELKSEFGRPLMPREMFGPQSGRTLTRLMDALLSATEQMTKLSISLLTRDRWDLFLVVFGAPHRAGHYLWDLSQIDSERLSVQDRQRLEGALVQIYQACDTAVARLIEGAPADTKILVFAVHGMNRNPGWSDRFSDILSRIQQVDEATPVKQGLLYQVKRMIPWQLAREITSRLPQSVLDRVLKLWSANMYDWATTRYFPLPMDHAGYLRINLKGREAQGLVEHGAEYDALCDALAEAFMSFRTVDGGEPIVQQVHRMDGIAPPDASYRDVLPDLVIVWNALSAIDVRAIRSDRYGEIRWDDGGKLQSGRCGNHSPRGWFLATGPGIPAGLTVDKRHAVDLVPTVLEWLGAQRTPQLQGSPIVPLCDDDDGPGTDSAPAGTD